MKMPLIFVLVVAAFLLPLAGFTGQKGDSGTEQSTPQPTQSTKTQSTGTSASAIAICGIKPPPPVGFWPDDAVCLCDGKKCKWVWMKR